MDEKYTFSILKSKYHTNENVILFEDNGFDKLKTKSRKKDEAPLWNMTTLPNRKENPTHMCGMIIDFDEKILPPLNTYYYYLFHRTHGDEWRIIVPFDKKYKFTTPSVTTTATIAAAPTQASASRL